MSNFYGEYIFEIEYLAQIQTAIEMPTTVIGVVTHTMRLSILQSML